MFGERGGRFFSLVSESVPDAVAIITSVFIGVNFHPPLPHFALCMQPHPQTVAATVARKRARRRSQSC